MGKTAPKSDLKNVDSGLIQVKDLVISFLLFDMFVQDLFEL